MQHFQVGVASWIAIAQGETPPMAGAPGAGQVESQGTAGDTGGGNMPPPGSPFGGMIWILPFFLIILWMMIASGRRASKERKQREEMLSGLRRNDRVQTTGGVLGKIVEVKAEEIVLKVDESTNTRIRFSRSAIQQVIKQGAGETIAEEDAG